MDALLMRFAILAAAIMSLGASYRTQNFIVEAPTPQMAEQIGQAAEKYRRELAIDWLGSEMRNWKQPCPITAQVGDHLGAGGATSFVFEHGEVFGWRMTIQGSLVRIIDSVLPHEVTHTIFATHFRRPLPRWADEGACTTVEHHSEKLKQQHMLIEFLRTNRGIAFSQMFAMREYPRDVMPLYSQGYSVARFLVAQGGKRKFVDYVGDGMKDENWTRATKQFYGYDNLAVLQNTWLDWVRNGSQPLSTPDTGALVAVSNPSPQAERTRPASNLIYRDGNSARDGSTAARGRNGEPSVYDLAANDRTLDADDDTWRPRGSKPSRRTAALPGPVADEEQPQSQQVTRPQGFERPRQVILEWSRPPGNDPPAPRPGSPGPG